MNNNKSRLIARVFCALAFTSLAVALLIAWLNPATGYELDIYASTPLATWALIGITMATGAGIIIHQLISKGYKHNRIWALGFALFVFARLAFLWVPYARGYLTWDGDNISHWGYIIDVLDTGYLYAENSYPVTHSILAQVIQITGLSIRTVTNLSTGILSAFYMVGIYLLSTRVTPQKKYQLTTVLLAGFIPLMGGYEVFLMPNGWSILFMPFLFYLFFSRKISLAYSIPFILILILFPFFHPLSSLMLALSFVVILIFSSLFWYFTGKNIKFNQINLKVADPLTPAMTQFVLLIPWILSFNQFIPNIRSMWAQITSGASSQFGGISDTLVKINMTGWDTVILFFKLYGVTAFMILISIAGMILLLVKIKKSKNKASYLPLLAIGSLVMFFGLLYLLYLIGFPGMSSIGADRMLSYLAMFTPIIGGYALVVLAKSIRFKPLFATLTILILGTVSFLGARGLYFSPYNLKPNIQVDNHSMAGSEWYVEAKNPDHLSATIMSPINRYADGILGRNAASARSDLGSSRIIQAEDHFGYNEYITIGEQYSNPLLLNITKLDRIIYGTVWDIAGRFKNGDFVKLDNDFSANKLYENGEYSAYLA
jgi:hypothetical protein